MQQLAAQIVQEGPAQTGRGQRMNWKPKTGPRPASPAPDERQDNNMNPNPSPTSDGRFAPSPRLYILIVYPN